MTAITGTTLFRRPVEEVFDFLADPAQRVKVQPDGLEALP
jgi:uncharacterized protein YndB with AHSA1/START domain